MPILDARHAFKTVVGPSAEVARAFKQSDPAIMAAAMSVTPHPNSAALQRK